MPPRRPAKAPPAALPDEAERALFREAIGAVRPVEVDADLRRASTPPPAPLPSQSLADERRVLDELLASDEALSGAASGEVLKHLQSGYPPKLLRQLRRGQFVVEAELDLHHLRVDSARQLLVGFLAECRRQRRLCLRIIHGKGSRSPEGSVLKALTDQFLRQRSEVIAFTSAAPAQGGSGAVLVLLRGK